MTSYLPLLGRLLIAVLFILAGAGKLGAVEATTAFIASKGIPMPMIACWMTIAVEILGGLALAAGFQTRLAALALAGFTLAAAALFHNDLASQSEMTSFLKNLAITGGLLQVVAFGAGSISLDARRSHR